MGRRGLSVEDDAHWVFNRLAGDYAFRPRYPEAVIARLVDLARAGSATPSAAPIVDLGAGTGHLSIPLSQRGLKVSAVEPARRMLESLRAHAPEVEAVHASAEDTGLPEAAFALVLVADALHWLDPELAGREAGRILAPGGACAVLEAKWGGSVFLDALLARVAVANPRARRAESGGLRQFFTLALGSRPLWTEKFDQELEIPSEALEGTVRSLSFVGPALGADQVAAIVSDARALAAAHGALWRRELRLTWSRRPEGA